MSLGRFSERPASSRLGSRLRLLTTTFHGLRATTATLLANAGVSPAVAMRILRHSDPRLTLKVYAKIDPLKDGHRELAKLDPMVPPADTCSAQLVAAPRRSVPPGRASVVASERSLPSTSEPLAPLGAVARNLAQLVEAEGEMVGRAGLEPASDRPPKPDSIGVGGVEEALGANSVATISSEDDEEAGEDPPTRARLAAALGVLRRLRNDMGTSVFGVDAELVERLLRGVP